MSDFDILFVTDRKLCGEPLLERIEKLSQAHPEAMILREKDLPEADYRELAAKALDICKKNGTLCILHNFYETAEELGAEALHLPLPVLRSLTHEERKMFRILGTSCHSPEEAKEAEELGCTYITAGHVFETDCKKDLPGRGIEFLEKVCSGTGLKVYAIGGINSGNISMTAAAGADGACVMSGCMTFRDPLGYIEELRNAVTRR